MIGPAFVVLGAALLVPKVAPGLLAGLLAPQADTTSSSPVRPDPAAENENPGYSRQMVLAADARGHFLATATVNGRAIDVVVDTGATYVALTSETAGRLGIYPARSEFNIPMSTANGSIGAAAVMLAEIRLGDITIRDVQATVMPPGVLPVNLLGMSFLGKLAKFQVSGGQLVLVQ
jgi:aspartyl protease family protein